MPHSMWNPPRPGIEPMPLALAGRFLSTVPPGKSCIFFFTNLNIYALCRASLWTQFFNSIVLKLRYRDFPGHQWLRPHTSPCASNAERAGFISGLQTKIPHAVWCGQKISKILNKIGVFLAIMLLYS